MEKYNSYKNSGIEWLGVIPEHWEVKRIKDAITKIGSGVTPKGGSETYVDEGIPLIRSQNVYNDGLRLDNVSFITEEVHNKMKNSQLKPFDVLINITGASIGRTCIFPESVKTANINQHIIYLRVKKKKVDYFAYYLKSSTIQEYIMNIQAGTSKEALNMSQILNIGLPFPELKEQTQIANYLDAKTIAIDKKISLLQQKTKHYKAYRKTSINQAVTKGLDKTVKLKDSGINWIGEIPEHWEVKRLKSLGNISTSSVNKKIEDDEKIVFLVNYTDVYGNLNKEIWNDSNYMKVSAKPNQIIQKNLKKGDVLFTPSSETVEDIGVSSLVMEDLKNTLYSYHILRLRFNHKIYDNFKKYMFNNDFVQYYFSKSAKGTTRKILGLNDFNNLQIILPKSIKEQQQIADYLDAKTRTIDKIVKNIETQIVTLKELRKTLINEVVTGKVKVSA